MMTEGRSVVIVGGGMAGLTAACYLAREGYEVLLLEKNNRCGGLVHTFEQKGFYFDAGPRAFVNSGIVQPMLRDLGIEWDFLPNRISIGIADELLAVESLDSLSDYRRVLAKFFPEYLGDIDAILAEIKKVSQYTQVISGFDNPSFTDIMSDKNYLFKELLPWLFKFLFTLRKLKRYQMPMESFLEGLTDNQSLQDILTQLFFRKTPTHFALGYFYVYLDYFYPRLGTGALPKLLEEQISSRGGKIRLNTEVTEILPAEKLVQDGEGHAYPYDQLIWAADLKTLYQKTTTKGLPPARVDEIKAKQREMEESRGAESVFILFLAVDRPPAYFRSRGGEHFFYSPLKSGLGQVNRSEREELLENFEHKTKAEVISWLERFCDYNTYEVSVPALRDESLAPPGKTGLMISCLFDFHLSEKIKSAGWYGEFKEYFENRVIENFSRTIFRDFKEDILFKFSSTPLTLKMVSGSSEGSITGWSFETPIPVVHELKDIPKSVLTPLAGVYQAGQWAYAPAGVPVAMLTGWHASQKVIKGFSKGGKA